MNFKKYILGLLAILFLSMPSFAEKQVFLGEGKVLVNNAGSLASHADIQASLSTIANLKSGNKLTKAIGSASDVELAAIHRYTENGGLKYFNGENGSNILEFQIVQ